MKFLIVKFIDKLVHHFQSGDVSEAIVLVNNATETEWFHAIAKIAHAICFPLRRIKFADPNGKFSTPLQGQAVIYLGPNVSKFADRFRPFGFVVGFVIK